MQMLDEGKPLRSIRIAIDNTYKDKIGSATPTPYPPT